MSSRRDTRDEMLQLLNDPPSDNSEASGEPPATKTEPPIATEPAVEPAKGPVPPDYSGLSLEKIRAEHEPQKKTKTSRRPSVLSRRREKEAAAKSGQSERDVQSMIAQERKSMEQKMYDDEDDGSYWRKRAGGGGQVLLDARTLESFLTSNLWADISVLDGYIRPGRINFVQKCSAHRFDVRNRLLFTTRKIF